MNLERFLQAQEHSYEIALNEIRNGKKKSHWMWYIFPQIKGLGYSSIAQYYAIQNRKEAEEYLKHQVLGGRLVQISAELMKLKSRDAEEIFGYIDAMKLKSSMTLFFLISGEEIYQNILDKFFDGEIDRRTEEILEKASD